MFCPNCGAKAAAGSVQCTQCGESFSFVEKRQTGSPFKSFLILLVSFFIMPWKTINATLQQLRELGNRGKIEIGETDGPHLTYLGAAGQFIVSIEEIFCHSCGAKQSSRSCNQD